jgi:dolichol-phosphate mannosyltransferase
MANEGADSVRFADAVLAETQGFGSAVFLAILDRASRDNTQQLLEERAASEPRLEVVWAPENRGLAEAYLRGYREAIAREADWILEIDAGFSHDPRDLPKFWAAMRQGCDCVFATRFSKGGRVVDIPLKRYLVSRGGSMLSNLLLGTHLADMTSGFELFSRDALEMVLDRGVQSRAHFFQTEIKVYCRKLKIAEVPITYRSPSPRLDNAALQDALTQLWRLFRQRLRGKL